jgi:hypothetical protein
MSRDRGRETPHAPHPCPIRGTPKWGGTVSTLDWANVSPSLPLVLCRP